MTHKADVIALSRLDDPDSWSVTGVDVLPFRFASNDDARLAAIWITKQVETVVRNCAAICNQRADPVTGMGSNYTTPGRECAIAILEAYGLK